MTIVGLSTVNVLNLELASSSPSEFSTATAIYPMQNQQSKYKIGTNEFLPIQHRLNISNEDLSSNFMILNGENKFEIVKNQDGNLIVNGSLDYRESTFIIGKEFNYSQPIPILVIDPIDLGKVTFKFATDELTKGGQSVIKKIAKQIVDSNLNGLYLVGNADNVGPNWYNLMISKKRVEKVKSLLKEELSYISGDNFSIETEFMSNYLTKGSKKSRDEASRSVTFLLYPTSG